MKILLICIFVFISSTLFGQSLSFVKEDITFCIENGYLTVDGYYWFKNQSAGKNTGFIYFPFCNSNDSLIVDSIEVVRMPEREPQAILSQNSNGISFNIEIAPNDSAIYNIRYRQKIVNGCAKYILLSTQNWGNPLELAEYKLIVSIKTKIKNFSYKPDKVYNINNNNVYYWKKKNFMPDKDMIFCF